MISYRLTKKIATGICMLLSHYSSCYCSIKLLPKKIDFSNIVVRSEENENVEKDVAIILQGPLYYKDDFTLETVKLYQCMFPECIVIVSTWDQENQSMIKKIKDTGCELILNKSIADGGPSNFNRQLVTSKAGVERAQSLGVKYVLKSRTDFRIYNRHAIKYLKNLVTLFSARRDSAASSQKIVVVDKYRSESEPVSPFWLQDFFYFGVLEDIVRFFDIKESRAPYKNLKDYLEKQGKKYASDREICNAGIVPEYNFITGYLKKFHPDGDYNDPIFFKECLKNHFIVISPWEMDLYFAYRRSAYLQHSSFVCDEGVNFSENYNIQRYIAALNPKTENGVL